MKIKLLENFEAEFGQNIYKEKIYQILSSIFDENVYADNSTFFGEPSTPIINNDSKEDFFKILLSKIKNIAKESFVKGMTSKKIEDFEKWYKENYE